jgi:hypothetical protein
MTATTFSRDGLGPDLDRVAKTQKRCEQTRAAHRRAMSERQDAILAAVARGYSYGDVARASSTLAQRGFDRSYAFQLVKSSRADH